MQMIKGRVIVVSFFGFILLLNNIIAGDDLKDASLRTTRPITSSNILKYSADELACEIEYHDNLYWKLNQPEITDEEYDILVERLSKVSPDHPILRKKKYVKVASSKSVKLQEPMLSLQKTYYFKNSPKGKKSLFDWLDKVKRSDSEEFLIQPKYDGISAVFLNGVLATRGDGNVGLDVTDKISIIELETVNYRGPLDKNARGELIFKNDEFIKHKDIITNISGRSYKTPRSAVAGIMNLNNIEHLKEQGVKLTLIDFETYSYKVSYKNFKKKWGQILQKIKMLPYPIDGVVIKLADEKYKKSLGATAHHPRGEIAYKFSSASKKSKILDVDWSIGANSITPVAIIAPVEINGVSITRVSMHNAGFIEKNDLHIGDYLIVERAGDTVPNIVRSIPGKERKSIKLFKCPSCHSRLVQNGNKLQCKNENCPEIKLQKMLKSIRALGIKGIGPYTAKKLLQDGKVTNLVGLFNLSKNDILSIPGFSKKTANKIYVNIQLAKNCTETQLLAALNIKGVGKTTAGNIVRQCSIKELLDMSPEQISTLKGVGSNTANSIHKFMQDNLHEVEKLLKVTNNY